MGADSDPARQECWRPGRGRLGSQALSREAAAPPGAPDSQTLDAPGLLHAEPSIPSFDSKTRPGLQLEQLVPSTPATAPPRRLGARTRHQVPTPTPRPDSPFRDSARRRQPEGRKFLAALGSLRRRQKEPMGPEGSLGGSEVSEWLGKGHSFIPKSAPWAWTLPLPQGTRAHDRERLSRAGRGRRFKRTAVFPARRTLPKHAQPSASGTESRKARALVGM